MATNLFYTIGGHRFIAAVNPFLVGAHEILRPALITYGVIIIALRLTKNISARVAFYLLLTLAIGPGLIVNAALKDNWGRARPHHTKIFEGTKEFTPFYQISNQCDKNCSFVAGDPSVGFYFFTLVFLIREKRRRQQAALVVCVLGLFLGYVRLAMGAHFLSDIIFSLLITYATTRIMHQIFFKK